MFRNKFIKFFMLSFSLLMLSNPFAFAMANKRVLNVVFYGDKSNGKTFFIRALCGYNGNEIYIGEDDKQVGEDDAQGQVNATEVGDEYRTFMNMQLPGEAVERELELSIYDTEGGSLSQIECSECMNNADIVVMTVKVCRGENNQRIVDKMYELYNSFCDRRAFGRTREGACINNRGNSMRFIFLCTMTDQFIEDQGTSAICTTDFISTNNMFVACENSILRTNGIIGSIGTVMASVRMIDVNDGSDNERMSLGVNRFKGLIRNLVRNRNDGNNPYYYTNLTMPTRIKKPLAPSYMFNSGHGRRSEGYGKKKTSFKGSFS
ncbi:MAG: hypothetical protein ACI35S_04485 [Anaeroplasma sp.]